MDQRTAMFLIFVAFTLVCFALGYVGRRRGWAAESWSRPLHFHTLIWFWSPVSMFAFWALPLRGDAGRELLILMLAQPLLMVLPALVMAVLAVWARCRRGERGVLILAAALSNHGFTLGAYVCYALLEPAQEAMAYGIAYVVSMQVFMVVLFYPVARHYGSDAGGGPPSAVPGVGRARPTRGLGELIVGSFLTFRATPLYAAGFGALLNLWGVPFPEQVNTWYIMDVLFFASAAGSYGGIGLRFRMGDSRGVLRLHGLLAMVQFAVHPLLALGLIGVFGVVTAGGGLVGPLVRDVILLQAFMPTALNTVIVANLFHLDARLASSLWLWNTLIFVGVVLPVLMVVY